MEEETRALILLGLVQTLRGSPLLSLSVQILRFTLSHTPQASLETRDGTQQKPVAEGVI